MAFLDKVKEAGSGALDKAKEAGDIGKLKLKISSAEGDIKSLYSELGKKLVENFPDSFNEMFPEEAAKLAELNASIEELKAQIAAVKEG